MRLVLWLGDLGAGLIWEHSPYWKGYRAGMAAAARAHEKYHRIEQKIVDAPLLNADNPRRIGGSDIPRMEFAADALNGREN